MKLKEYLKLNKISNKEFSKLIGITPVSLSRYISGERIPEKEIVLKIFEFTHGSVSPDDFYFQKKNTQEFDSDQLILINQMSKQLKNGSKKALSLIHI